MPVTFELITRVHVALMPSGATVGVAHVSVAESGTGLTEGVPIVIEVGVAGPSAVAVMVNVCAVPTWFVPDGAMEILPSTHFLTLLFVAPDPCGAGVEGSLSRVSTVPWTLMLEDTNRVAV